MCHEGLMELDLYICFFLWENWPWEGTGGRGETFFRSTKGAKFACHLYTSQGIF